MHIVVNLEPPPSPETLDLTQYTWRKLRYLQKESFPRMSDVCLVTVSPVNFVEV